MRSLMHMRVGKIKKMARPLRTAFARLHLVPRRAQLTGAYPTRESALAAVPNWALADYNHDEMVTVALDKMSQIIDWDYPVMFWLDRELRARSAGWTHLLDAGGHVGTKYRAFRPLLDLSRVKWQVYELPPMARAGAEMARADGIGPELSFCDDLAMAAKAEILLCSGLLQYLDIPFPDFVARLPAPPDVILLNKVALRDGQTVFTLQRGGPAFFPYQIRSKERFLSEIKTLGYDIVDSWNIQHLAHQISSHPELGWSESRGFMLRRQTA